MLLFQQLFAQSVGSKVSIVGEDGKNYTGVITAIQGSKYNVKYDGYDFNAWLTGNQFKIIQSTVPVPYNNNTNRTSGFKTGDIVEVQDTDGSWLPADVLEVSGGKYKIHYRGWSSNWDTWVGDERIRTVGSKKGNTPPAYDYKRAPKDPEMNGSIPKIIGTAWSLLSIYNKGAAPKYNHIYYPYLFGNNGRYEIQFPGMVTMGKYKVSGSQLTQVADGADRLTETYTLKWNAAGKYLELVGSKTIIRLQYNTVVAF